jgi:putative tricarboxylic transport membrane protein
VGWETDIVLQGLEMVTRPANLLVIFFGVLGGIIVGIIPGLSSTMAVALMIPFTFAMSPPMAMSLLTAVFVGGVSGGCVTAILIRMPGTPASVATILDGFPMAQKGLAGQAIGNAVIASFFGTIISGIFLVLLAPGLANMAMKFHFAEYVAVTVFALIAVISITGSSLARGFLTCAVGLLAATFGLSNEDGLPRFTFDSPAMMGGINLIPALMGIFAVSQMIHEGVRGLHEHPLARAKMGRIFPTLRDVRSNIWNYLRSSFIGTFVGIVPALGGGPAGLISYSQARSASPYPERFGTGVVEGVIASEASNNATIGGALIIALTLGIPGDPVTAVLLGGLMIHGLQPGPLLFINNPDIIYAIYFSVFFGSLCMAFILLTAVKPLSRVVEIPRRILVPVLFLLAASGVFALNNRLFDVLVMCFFGGLGYIFDRYRYPLPPFILGLLLGPLIEGNFRMMVGQYGNAWPLFTKPIALVFMVLSVAFLGYSLYRHHKGKEFVDGRGDD